VTLDAAQRARLCVWFASRLPSAEDVALEGVDAHTLGHSAETVLATLTWGELGRSHAQDVVLRLRPPYPGLLEPYDLARQFRILRALEPTPVRAPRALWHETTGEVLGREFYVMESAPGTVYERAAPGELRSDPDRVGRMCEEIVEQIAAIHRVDLDATGLRDLDDGRDYVDRELDHWEQQARSHRRGPVPALDRLLAGLRDRQPTSTGTVTLVHGDPKPGNFAFVGGAVSAVFDWELATVGDPLADLGWAEVSWTSANALTALPGGLTPDEMVARYEERTGIAVHDRAWYRAFQTYKMSVIMFVAAMLFDAGHSDDLRFAAMGGVVHEYTCRGLTDLGLDTDVEPGSVTARAERVRAVREASRG
jgi:aminoglycoside phosphotransferase (APT) family kinase protein